MKAAVAILFPPRFEKENKKSTYFLIRGCKHPPHLRRKRTRVDSDRRVPYYALGSQIRISSAHAFRAPFVRIERGVSCGVFFAF